MTRIGLFLAAATLTVQGQPQPVVLSIEVENSVMYFDDVGDPRAYSSTIERRVLSAGPQESWSILPTS